MKSIKFRMVFELTPETRIKAIKKVLKKRLKLDNRGKKR